MEQATVSFIKEFLNTPARDWNVLIEKKLKHMDEAIKSGNLTRRKAEESKQALTKAHQKVKLLMN